MTRDIIELNNYLVLIEQSDSEQTTIDTCGFEDEVIGFGFYGSGNVELTIQHGGQKKLYDNTQGLAMSFFANDKTKFVHSVSPKRPLHCICVVIRLKNLDQLPEQEREIFHTQLTDLLNTKEDFMEGPSFFMNHDMQYAIDKVFNLKYSGKTRLMFLRSQVTELLAHFFGLLAAREPEEINFQDREKLYEAKDIIAQNIAKPPSLQELSKLIGLNSNKLKRNFKELFGVPVFKHLQNERLNKAHDLLRREHLSIQEAAWAVGYESLGSFSNAFYQKFGYRPSEVRK